MTTAAKPTFDCFDCHGTGRNKTGGPCKTCRGTGKVGKIGAGFQAFMALGRVGVVLVVIIIIAIAVISGGGSSSKPASAHHTAFHHPSGLQYPESVAAKACEWLSFATNRLCETEFVNAYDEMVMNNGQADGAAFHDVSGLLKRCKAQHHGGNWCANQIGQELAQANQETS